MTPPNYVSQYRVRVQDETPFCERMISLQENLGSSNSVVVLWNILEWFEDVIANRLPESVVLGSDSTESLHVTFFKDMTIYYVTRGHTIYPYGIVLPNDPDYVRRRQAPAFSSKSKAWIVDTEEGGSLTAMQRLRSIASLQPSVVITNLPPAAPYRGDRCHQRIDGGDPPPVAAGQDSPQMTKPGVDLNLHASGMMGACVHVEADRDSRGLKTFPIDNGCYTGCDVPDTTTKMSGEVGKVDYSTLRPTPPTTFTNSAPAFSSCLAKPAKDKKGFGTRAIPVLLLQDGHHSPRAGLDDPECLSDAAPSGDD